MRACGSSPCPDGAASAATVVRDTMRCCARGVGPLTPPATPEVAGVSPMRHEQQVLHRPVGPPAQSCRAGRQGGLPASGCLHARRALPHSCLSGPLAARSERQRCFSWRPAPRAELQGLAGWHAPRIGDRTHRLRVDAHQPAPLSPPAIVDQLFMRHADASVPVCAHDTHVSRAQSESASLRRRTQTHRPGIGLRRSSCSRIGTSLCLATCTKQSKQSIFAVIENVATTALRARQPRRRPGSLIDDQAVLLSLSIRRSACRRPHAASTPHPLRVKAAWVSEGICKLQGACRAPC